MQRDLIERTAELILNAEYTVALTGAGISTESGVPDFRSVGGLWDRFDPHLFFYQHFLNDPAGVWRTIAAMYRDQEFGLWRADPNRGHIALAYLEEQLLLQRVITQNIDNLHQQAGSRDVVEFHGNMQQARCISCRRIRDLAGVLAELDGAPRCECGGLLKPDAVFFGEAIPQQALDCSYLDAQNCDLMIVVGTSAQVEPAASLPLMAKGISPISLGWRDNVSLPKPDCKVVEINREPTPLSEEVSDYVIQGSAGEVLAAIVQAVKEQQ